ncbi:MULTISPECIES: hypothetical protein [unclassified Streptomyces]|uniref:hypothetical protein n=1 Tax=unclassified Streptomyces TaxID=2593676 RepID=UPI0036E40256
MHGHGYAPPPPQLPSQAAQIGLRVLFVALVVLSVGFLAWTALLRLALTTRSRTDWIVFGSGVALQIAIFAVLATDPGKEEFTTWRGNAGMSVQLVMLAGVVIYYLIADIRFDRKQRVLFGVYVPQQPPRTTPPAYGYPQQYTPPPPHEISVHAQPTQTAGQAPTPVPTPAPQPQAPPHRIDQVRAELDELSDYLRKHEGGR